MCDCKGMLEKFYHAKAGADNVINIDTVEGNLPVCGDVLHLLFSLLSPAPLQADSFLITLLLDKNK